jgi:hypothetical protein
VPPLPKSGDWKDRSSPPHARRTRALGTCLAFCGLLSLSACDNGLSPLNEPSGFAGTIHFSNWPPADSVLDLRLVAFENFPNDSSGILVALVTGKAVFYPAGGSGLPPFTDAIAYQFTTQGTSLQVKEYAYVAVALQYGPNILNDWKPVGVYTNSPDTFDPAPVRVLLHRVTGEININVDFHHLPPKPWR